MEKKSCVYEENSSQLSQHRRELEEKNSQLKKLQKELHRTKEVMNFVLFESEEKYINIFFSTWKVLVNPVSFCYKD